MSLVRVLSLLCGVGIVGASTHVVVESTSGYGEPQAFLTTAIGAGVIMAAIGIGHASSSRRRWLAAMLALSLVAGEAYNVLASFERLISTREATQAPARAAAEAVNAARARIQAAEAALAAVPTTSSRLTAALAAKATADQAAVSKASEKGCAANCRELLSQQVTDATSEVNAARAELDTKRVAAETEVLAARKAIGAIQVPASGTALADRVGVPAWVLDLVVAALQSIGSAGLGATLIALGAHEAASVRAIRLPGDQLWKSLPEPTRA